MPVIKLNDDVTRTKEYTFKKIEFDIKDIPTETNKAIVFVTNTISQIFDIQECEINFQSKKYPKNFVKDLNVEVNKCLSENGYFGPKLDDKIISLIDDSKYYTDILKPEDGKPSLLLMIKEKKTHIIEVFKIIAAALNYISYCDNYKNTSHEIRYETTEENLPLDEENITAKIMSVCSTMDITNLYDWHKSHYPNASIQMILDIYYVLIRDTNMIGYDYLRHYDYFSNCLSYSLYEYMYLVRSIDNHTPNYITADIIDTFAFYKNIFGKFKTISVFNLLTQVIYPYVIGLRAAIEQRSDSELFISPYDHVIAKSKYTPFGICSVVAQVFTNRASNILVKKCDYFDYMTAWDGKWVDKYFVEIPIIARTIQKLMAQKPDQKAHMISPFIDHPVILIFIIHYLKEKIPSDYPLFTQSKLADMMNSCKSLASLQMLENINDYCKTNDINFDQTNESIDNYMWTKSKGKIKSYTASKYNNGHLKDITNKIMHSDGKYQTVKNIINWYWQK